MPPEMHIGNEPNANEVILANRIAAQIKVAEYMGVKNEDILDWIKNYGELFAKLEASDSELIQKIHAGELDNATLRYIKDQIMEYDTGKEFEEEELIRAA